MTEVRASSLSATGSLGVFATRPFQVGDIIVQEDAPLVVLTGAAPSCLVAFHHHHHHHHHNNNNKDLQQWWDELELPSTVPPEQAGNFRGMLQAAAAYAEQQQQQQARGNDKHHHHQQQQALLLLQLYHPSLERHSEEEKQIVEVAKEAVRYLEKNAVEGSALKQQLMTDAEDNDVVARVMLVWACNSFAGGRVYDQQSRFNHSCDPNAVVQPMAPDGQLVRAACSIAVGEEITISYLGLFLYSDAEVRRQQLLRNKHFWCRCVRCREGAQQEDMAAAIPCPSCHPRHHGRYLDEDVQYDDDGSVHYAVPPSPASNTVECQHCHETVSAPQGESNPSHVLQLARKVSEKVETYLQNHRQHEEQHATTASRERNDYELAVEEELEEQLVQLSSAVLGARHWATNLMILTRLDRTLQLQHSSMITNGIAPDLTDVAASIDSLERLLAFVDGLHLRLHMGHLLSNSIVGVARTLVSLGDAKSKKYAADWLAKIEEGYVEHFESEGMKKVVRSLSNAWKNQNSGDIEVSMDTDQDDNDLGGSSKKRTKLS